MRFAFVLITALIAISAIPNAGGAQAPSQVASAEVTLTVPIDLKQLGPEITKVRVDCTIGSPAITNGDQFKQIAQQQEIPVSGGAVQTTASVKFSFTNLDNPVGKSADVSCMLWGYSQPAQKWAQFHPAQTDPSFRTDVTVGGTRTTFVW